MQHKGHFFEVWRYGRIGIDSRGRGKWGYYCCDTFDNKKDAIAYVKAGFGNNPVKLVKRSWERSVIQFWKNNGKGQNQKKGKETIQPLKWV